MAIPVIIAANQTGGNIFLSRLGLTVPGSGTLTLTDYAFEDEIRSDEDLQTNVVSGNILLNFGQGNLTQGESIKFFNIVTLEMRIPVKALADANVVSLSGTTTLDTIPCNVNDRVLLTNQSTGSQNGVWVIKAGAWQRPDDFGTGQSASQALVAVDQGATYGEQIWQCTTNLGTDVIDTNSLSWQQTSGGGGGDTLQTAYDAGNTITTASARDIAFTLTNGDFTVDDGDILFGAGTALDNFTVDTGIFSIDSTDSSNLSMTANDTNPKTLTIAATNAGSGTGNLDINVDDAITIDSANAGFSIDGVTASNVTVTGASQDLTLSSVGGSVNIDGSEAAADAVSIQASAAAGGIDIDAGTAGITVDTTGTLVMNSVGSSSWTNDSGNLDLTTTTTGVIEIDGVDGVEINSSAGALRIGNDADTGDIDIGTGAAVRDITIGNKTGATSLTLESGTGNTLMDTPQVRITGDLVVDGTTTTLHTEEVNVSDNFFYMNADYTTTAGLEGGLVVNYLPTATNDTVAAGGFTAGVAGVSNPTVVTTGGSTFAVGDIIQVSGANDQSNDGVYEVLSHTTAPNILTVTGVGLTGTSLPFLQNDFQTDATVAGTITKINVSAIQTDTSGDWQVGAGNTTVGWTWNDITTGATTLSLQTAYEGGNTITTAAADGNVIIAGTELFQITATGGLDVDTIADFDVTTFDVQMTGTNGFSIDGTAASNVTVDSGNLTLSTTTSGEVLIDGVDGVEINSSGGAIDIGQDADDNAINIGTGTTTGRAITIGNNTGTTGVTINSGSEMVEIDGVTYYGLSAGNPTPTGSGFQDGDKYYDTTIDKEMRYDGTRTKWLSVETAYIQIGRNFNAAAGQYYRAIDGRVMSSTEGYPAFYDGTIVAFAYTRTDTDATTFEIVEDGTNRATLASAAVKGRSNTLDGDFSQDGVLAVRNASGGNTTSNVVAWVAVKWRG